MRGVAQPVHQFLGAGAGGRGQGAGNMAEIVEVDVVEPQAAPSPIPFRLPDLGPELDPGWWARLAVAAAVGLIAAGPGLAGQVDIGSVRTREEDRTWGQLRPAGMARASCAGTNRPPVCPPKSVPFSTAAWIDEAILRRCLGGTMER